MKWQIVATERIIATNTYIVEAETEDEAVQEMLDEEIEERTTSYESERELQQIVSIQPYKEGAQ